MAKILKIVTEPNEILRRISQEVDEKIIKTPKFQEFLEDMALTMEKEDGVGLAAPQIGENIRVIVIETKEKDVLCMINPVITKKSWAKAWGEEGCLSVPKTFGNVQRHKKIKCIFLDKTGKKKQLEASGFIARIIQHEIDHLDGILFIDVAKGAVTK